MIRYLSACILCLVCAFAIELQAQESLAEDYAAQPPNLREFCRREIAGQYLEYYDTYAYNKRMLEHLYLQAKQLETEIATNQIILDKKQQELAKVIFDESLSSEMETVKSKQDAMKNALSQNRDQSVKLAPEVKEQEKLAESFLQQIKGVFAKKPINGRGAGYKFYIGYIEQCPAYRYGCPLSSKASGELKKITFTSEKNWKLPESCLKYADYLQRIK